MNDREGEINVSKEQLRELLSNAVREVLRDEVRRALRAEVAYRRGIVPDAPPADARKPA